MLLLFSDPRMGLGLALKAAVSARERTEFVDVHGKGAVRFVDDPVISHALNMARSRVSATGCQAAEAACYSQTDPLPFLSRP